MILIQPLASLGVRLLARLGVDPLAVVLTHGVLGLLAALLIALDGAPALRLAALALVLKTILDNIDGGLARATGRVTEMGRYLDTVVDLVVNAALFGALSRHGPLLPAVLAFATLTLILSLDFNMERLYRLERTPPGRDGADEGAPIGAPRPLFDLVRGTYRTLLAPQDRLIARLDRLAFERITREAHAAASLDRRLAWSDLFSTATLVNLGLSSQMLLLAALLLAGRPYGYVGAVGLQGVYVVGVQLLRPLRMRAYLRR